MAALTLLRKIGFRLKVGFIRFLVWLIAFAISPGVPPKTVFIILGIAGNPRFFVHDAFSASIEREIERSDDGERQMATGKGS